ncbi:myosin phosphatase Rho-interacting protein-like [Periophthalmus magnuspinnatus]|uniref:myosin phosphatase Rho-interacting protein-like n=1 Tax=Periophthalmus magnuspinnatus TaxID=409849 RepID=UPI00243694AD|nr:myosin phosphatase Rho-interacting protein-like [Periophthalmus magnuspinnatus]
MTSRIRRNWVKLLKQAIQNKSHQSESGSEKENPLSQRRSSCQPSAQFAGKESRREPAAVHSHQELSQREEGEGWDREQAKRLEERNRWFEEGLSFNEMCSRWDSMELKKGSVPIPVIDTIDTEVNRKWSEFERLSFRDMTAQSLIGNGTSNSQQSPDCPSDPRTLQFTHEERVETFSAAETTNNYISNTFSVTNGAQNSQTSTTDALQKEAISLRKQVESVKKEHVTLGVEVDSPCGPGAPCRAKLEAMLTAHQRELQELQERHDEEIRELKEQRDRMLQEESHAAAKAMEKLKATHLEEMERELKKAQGSGTAALESMQKVSQVYALHSELDALSGDYSQKCLELNHSEINGKSRETELRRKERELEQLRRENQELKARLAEEISRMRCFITGQNSEKSDGSSGEKCPQIEIALKAKENEVLCLRKEISCLQSEVQSLTKEKEEAYERYKSLYAQLTDTQGRSQLEKNSLTTQLRLANAALQEEQKN